LTPDFNKLRQLIQQEIQKEKETHPFVHRYQDAEGRWHVFKTNIYDWEGAIPVVSDIQGDKVKIQWVKPSSAWQNLYTTKSVVYDPELQAWVDIGLYNKLHKQQIRQPDLTPEQIQQLNKANEGDVRNRRNDYIIRGWKDGKEIEFRAETEDEAFIRAEQLKEQGYTYQVIRPENVSWKYGSLPEFLAKHPELAKELKNRRIKDVIRENGKIKLILEPRQPSEQPKKQPSEPKQFKGRDTGLRVKLKEYEKELKKLMEEKGDEGIKEFLRRHPEFKGTLEVKGLKIGSFTEALLKQKPKKENLSSAEKAQAKVIEAELNALETIDTSTNPIERAKAGAILIATEGVSGITRAFTGKSVNELIPKNILDLGAKYNKVLEDISTKITNFVFGTPEERAKISQTLLTESGTISKTPSEQAIKMSKVTTGERIAHGAVLAPIAVVSTPSFVYDILTKPAETIIKTAESWPELLGSAAILGLIPAAESIVSKIPTDKIAKVTDKVIPVRQTVIKGARIIEYEKETPQPHEVAFRVDTPTEMLDITNKGLRKVELITEKRWKLGKSVESLEIPEHAKTLAEVKEIVKEKTHHGEVFTTVKKGLGKAEIEFHRTEPVKEIKTIEDVSSALMGEKEGRMVNVKAETIASPSERRKVLEKLHKEFKQEGVESITFKASSRKLKLSSSVLKEADEVVKKGLEAYFEEEPRVRYLRKVEDELVPKAQTPKRLRIVEVKFRPDITKEILKESKKIEKLEGKTVKPEELIPKEKEIRLTESIREVEMKPAKEEAIERMMTKEYRKELAKTIKSLQEGGSINPEEYFKSIEKANKEWKRFLKSEKGRKAILDYKEILEGKRGRIRPEEYFKSIEKANKEWENFLKSEEGKRAILDYKKILEETKESPTKQKLELVEKPKEEIEHTKPLEDYPVLEEKPITDMIKEALKPVKEMFERISKGAGLGVGLAEIGKNIEKANRIAENIFKINVEFKPIEMSKPFENVKVKPKTKPIEESKPFEEFKPYVGELPALSTGTTSSEILSPALATKQTVRVTEELNVPPVDAFPVIFKPPFIPKFPQQTSFDEILFGWKSIRKGVKVNPVAYDPFKLVITADNTFNKLFKEVIR